MAKAKQRADIKRAVKVLNTMDSKNKVNEAESNRTGAEQIACVLHFRFPASRPLSAEVQTPLWQCLRTPLACNACLEYSVRKRFSSAVCI